MFDAKAAISHAVRWRNFGVQIKNHGDTAIPNASVHSCKPAVFASIYISTSAQIHRCRYDIAIFGRAPATRFPVLDALRFPGNGPRKIS
jgi:hypothetical protein